MARIVDTLTVEITFDCSEAMRTLAAAHNLVRRIDPHCCFIDCAAPAVVAIYDTRPETPYDKAETHSCADHVRELGGEESYSIVKKFGKLPPGLVADIVQATALPNITERPPVIHVTNAGPVRDVDTSSVAYGQIRSTLQRMLASEE